MSVPEKPTLLEAIDGNEVLCSGTDPKVSNSKISSLCFSLPSMELFPSQETISMPSSILAIQSRAGLCAEGSWYLFAMISYSTGSQLLLIWILDINGLSVRGSNTQWHGNAFTLLT